jgi:hypothetical protein
VSCISFFFVALVLLVPLFYHGSFINHQGMSAFVAGGVYRADSDSNETIFVPQCSFPSKLVGGLKCI